MEINKLNQDLKKKYNKYFQQYGSVLFINKNNIVYNSTIISNKSKKSKIFPVIKANAYGMGVIAITKVLIELGYKSIFLANIAEGVEVRKKFKSLHIYILNCGQPLNTQILIKYKLIPVLNSLLDIKSWTYGSLKNASCVIHLDTGMNRLGLSYSDILDLKKTKYINKLNIKFIMTHLACAENIKNKFNEIQLNKLQKYTKIISTIKNQSIKSSICNSSGIWLGEKYLLNIVRPGASFLGINPLLNKQNPLKETVSMYAQITQIRKAFKNTSIGYGQTIKLKKDSLLATISVGYSNGLSRLLSNKGSVYIKNKKLNILGRVSMDLTVIDISRFNDGELEIGDIVEIFGPNKSLENFAKENSTIPYEILCNIDKNIPKIIV
jgi:alanine racemase